jgi:hypothetical protein
MDQTQRIALATGVAGIASTACLGLLFAVGEPFGLLNDLGNGVVGVLSAALAASLARGTDRRSDRRSGTRANAAVAAAAVGGAITIAGSALVVSGTTGFVLAGLVSSVGFACIGLWLADRSRAMARQPDVPRSLVKLGMVAGLTMATGFVAIPGIVLRLDDMATLPGWAWLAFVGWLGTFVLYPVWAIALSRVGSGTTMRAVEAPST